MIILKKQCLFVKEFLKSGPLGMELWDKTFNFEDNIRLVVLKMIVSKKITPAYEESFQIWPLGTELWDKTSIFEDNIGLLYSK